MLKIIKINMKSHIKKLIANGIEIKKNRNLKPGRILNPAVNHRWFGARNRPHPFAFRPDKAKTSTNTDPNRPGKDAHARI